MSRESMRDNKVVLVATESAPTSYTAEGKQTGFLVDIMREAFRRAGRPLEIRFLPFARCLEEAKDGRADGVFVVYRTPQRESFFNFSDEVVLILRESLFVRKGDAVSVESGFGSLSDKRLGMVNQTWHGARLGQAMSDGVIEHVEFANTFDAAVRMLAEGQVDVVAAFRDAFLGTARGIHLDGEIEELLPPIDEEPSYVAFTKTRDMNEVRRAFDNALHEMKKDGTYARIYVKYFR